MGERNILEDELPSSEFLANNHSGLTFYDAEKISFDIWCRDKSLWYVGWCNDTCYWNPLDNSHSPGFLFFNLENEDNIWIHGFGLGKKEILEWIYSKEAFSLRFPNEKRDSLFREIPFPSFKKFALSIFLENFQKPLTKEASF